jgi:hypothetical protein
MWVDLGISLSFILTLRVKCRSQQVVVQFDKEASQTRDDCVAKNATLRAARPDPSLRTERLFRMTIKLPHYQSTAGSLRLCSGQALTGLGVRFGMTMTKSGGEALRREWLESLLPWWKCLVRAAMACRGWGSLDCA